VNPKSSPHGPAALRRTLIAFGGAEAGSFAARTSRGLVCRVRLGGSSLGSFALRTSAQPGRHRAVAVPGGPISNSWQSRHFAPNFYKTAHGGVGAENEAHLVPHPL
jgi:hypothetical protein